MREFGFFSSKQQEYNMEMAKMAINYVKKNLVYGEVNKSDSLGKIVFRQSQRSQKPPRKDTKRLINSSDLTNRMKVIRYPSTPLNTEGKEPSERQRNHAVRYKFSTELNYRTKFRAETLEVGNCDEQVAVALMWLKSRYVEPVEDFFMEDADHRFIVIGRVSGNFNDPHSWNNDAVICDPWAGEAYFAKEFVYGTVFHKPVNGRKQALQSQGFPVLVYTQDFYNISNIFNIPYLSYFQKNIISFVGYFEQEFDSNLTYKDFFILEKLKDEFLRVDFCIEQKNAILDILDKYLPASENIDSFLLKLKLFIKHNKLNFSEKIENKIKVFNVSIAQKLIEEIEQATQELIIKIAGYSADNESFFEFSKNSIITTLIGDLIKLNDEKKGDNFSELKKLLQDFQKQFQEENQRNDAIKKFKNLSDKLQEWYNMLYEINPPVDNIDHINDCEYLNCEKNKDNGDMPESGYDNILSNSLKKIT